MTSEEIKKTPHEMVRVADYINADTASQIEMAIWLKEIAYQLSLWNEAILPVLAEERERSQRWKRDQEERQKQHG